MQPMFALDIASKSHISQYTNVNVNANVCVYSLISPWVQQSSQFTTLVLKFALMQPHLLWGEFKICSLCCSYSQYITIQRSRSTRYPSLLGGQKQHCMKGLLDTSTHDWQRDSNTGQWLAVTHLSTNRALSVLWSSDLTETGYHSAMCYQWWFIYFSSSILLLFWRGEGGEGLQLNFDSNCSTFSSMGRSMRYLCDLYLRCNIYVTMSHERKTLTWIIIHSRFN